MIRRWLPLFAALSSLHAGEIALRIDPSQTTVQFKLGAVLHSVRGTFQLKSGNIRFDDGTGAASGEIVIDAASGQSGNADRDRDMHEKVLESGRFPEIAFHPKQVSGKVSDTGSSKIVLIGQISIHGANHDISLPLQVEATGGRYSASGAFTIPYVKWGLKNPSKALLRVSENVEINIRGVAERAR
jgi:polyisoprenoid-binding protein YceI